MCVYKLQERLRQGKYSKYDNVLQRDALIIKTLPPTLILLFANVCIIVHVAWLRKEWRALPVSQNWPRLTNLIRAEFAKCFLPICVPYLEAISRPLLLLRGFLWFIALCPFFIKNNFFTYIFHVFFFFLSNVEVIPKIPYTNLKENNEIYSM